LEKWNKDNVLMLNSSDKKTDYGCFLIKSKYYEWRIVRLLR